MNEKMPLSDRIVELLVGSAVLTFWLVLGGLEAWKQFLAEKEITIPLGEGGIVFSGLVLVGLSGMIGAYLLLWSIRRRRSAV